MENGLRDDQTTRKNVQIIFSYLSPDFLANDGIFAINKLMPILFLQMTIFLLLAK